MKTAEDTIYKTCLGTPVPKCLRINGHANARKGFTCHHCLTAYGQQEYERGQGQGWVPVSERLPETNAFGWSDPVAIWPALVWRPGEEFALPGKWGSGVKRAYFNKDGSFYGSSLEDDAETGIQMWCPQPLPAPPKEQP